MLIVKGKDYLLIVDNRGYIHHIGRSNLLNLAVCHRILGLLQPFDRLPFIVKCITSEGFSIENNIKEDMIMVWARAVEAHYRDGLAGIIPQTNSCGEKTEIENMEKKFIDRIDIFVMLEDNIRRSYEEKNIPLSTNTLRRITQTTYRFSSKDELMKELKQKRIREIELGLEQWKQERNRSI